MPPEAPGRIVEVHTKFHSEAVKPGGVSRDGAAIVARESIADLQAEVKQQIAESLDGLLLVLSDWSSPDARLIADACRWAATVRDMAGLADMRLLTEVAMHAFDCLDAVLVDGVSLSAAEAAIYADALVFARGDLCRGKDLTPYVPLLTDLSALTDHVIERDRQP